MDYESTSRWLQKQYFKASKRKNLEKMAIINGLKGLVEAARLAAPKPPAPSATWLSEPLYSPGYLPEALPPAPTLGRVETPEDPIKRRTRDLIRVQEMLGQIDERARVLFETEYPDRSVQWGQLNSHTQRPYLEQAKLELKTAREPITDDVEFSEGLIEERAREMFRAANPDLMWEWDKYPYFRINWRERAIAELRVEHRARDRYEETKEFNDPGWTEMPEPDRQQWIVNERSAMR